jgi:hypothetical protein
MSKVARNPMTEALVRRLPAEPTEYLRPSAKFLALRNRGNELGWPDHLLASRAEIPMRTFNRYIDGQYGRFGTFERHLVALAAVVEAGERHLREVFGVPRQ